jgi:hypothetical protein
VPGEDPSFQQSRREISESQLTLVLSSSIVFSVLEASDVLVNMFSIVEGTTNRTAKDVASKDYHSPSQL